MSSKKPSLAQALQPLDRGAPPPVQTATEPPPRKQPSAQPPSRQDKKALIGYFVPEVSKQLKQIALDRDTSVQDLLGEALNDFFQKNKKPTIA